MLSKLSVSVVLTVSFSVISFEKSPSIEHAVSARSDAPIIIANIAINIQPLFFIISSIKMHLRCPW